MLSPRAIKKSSAVLKKHTFLLFAKYNIESLCKSIEQLFTGVFGFLRYLRTYPPLFCPARSKAPFQLTKENKSYRIYQVSVQRESNPHRITAALSGAFGFIVLDLRQQACVLCIQNHPNNSRRNVLCSFFGADFRPDEALAAGNTWRILKANNEVWAYIRPIKTDAGSIPVGPGRCQAQKLKIQKW